MNFSTLVQAVIIYMKDHYPTTPEEFNFQAELKAASLWHWSDKEKERPLEPGPHDDYRVKIAADFTSAKWENELKKMSAPSSAKTRSPSPMKEDRRISGELLLFSLAFPSSKCFIVIFIEPGLETSLPSERPKVHTESG